MSHSSHVSFVELDMITGLFLVTVEQRHARSRPSIIPLDVCTSCILTPFFHAFHAYLLILHLRNLPTISLPYRTHYTSQCPTVLSFRMPLPLLLGLWQKYYRSYQDVLTHCDHELGRLHPKRSFSFQLLACTKSINVFSSFKSRLGVLPQPNISSSILLSKRRTSSDMPLHIVATTSYQCLSELENQAISHSMNPGQELSRTIGVRSVCMP